MPSPVEMGEEPDGQSLMLIDKVQSNSRQVGIAFEGAGESPKYFLGAISMVTFGSDQYMWKSDGPNGHPDPDSPPVTKTLPLGTTSITLPLRARLAYNLWRLHG